MMYWIMENKEEDFVQVYEESSRWRGWRIIYQTYGLKKFNENDRHRFMN